MAVVDFLPLRDHPAPQARGDPDQRIPRETRKSPARHNSFSGQIKTVTLNVKAKFAPAEKDNDKAPDYRIFAGQTELGAAWKRTSNAGREYLSVKLDDPTFPAPIFASLVAVEGGDSYALIWSRRSGD
jgi:uncharacterized protein (DUF736 family)